MARAISNKNVLQARFNVAEFDGAFKASFGRPELRGTWLIYGGSGCGKTTFVMELCKYLTRFGRVAYNSLEQGLSLSLQKAWERVNMAEAGTRIILLDKESLKELTARLKKTDPAIRKFWVDHGIACLRIAEYFGRELKSPCAINFWCPDGYKDEPSDRLGPRQRMAESLDKIFKYRYDRRLCVPTLESKLFGIGLESYTVNSHEFVMGYAMKRGILALLDMGHFHISESVADKISSFLMTFGKVAFHISRPVRWDSDHVIRQNDDLRACAQEIVKMGPENFIVALDYFDASINRVAAWVLGMRNMQKELLKAMLVPWKDLTKLQDTGALTAQLVLQEEYKNYPVDEVWAEFCKRNGVVADESWFKAVEKYEKDVLLKR